MHTAHTRARHTERCLQRVMGRLATFPDIQNVMTNAAAYVAWGRCNGWKYSGGIGIWCSVGEWFFEASILLQQRDNAHRYPCTTWGSVGFRKLYGPNELDTSWFSHQIPSGGCLGHLISISQPNLTGGSAGMYHISWALRARVGVCGSAPRQAIAAPRSAFHDLARPLLMTAGPNGWHEWP